MGRVLAALVVVVVGLGLALWFSEGEKRPEPTLTDPVLDGRHLLEARRIVTRREPTAMTVELARDDGGQFRIEEPLRDLASSAVLEALAKAWDGAQLVLAYEGDAVTEQILADTGVAEPRAFLEAEWDDGHRIRLDIGLEGPFGHDLFALRDGKVYRVDQGLYTALQVNPDGFREPFVFRNTAQLVIGLRIDRRTPSGGREILEVRRQDGGGPFQMVRPKDVRLDQGAVLRLVAGIVTLRVEEFLTGAPNEPLDSPGPAAPPQVEILVDGLAGRETVTLNFLPDGSLLGAAAERGIHFVCPGSSYRTLLEVPLRDLRAFWLLPFAIEEAEQIRIDPGAGRGAALVLERPGRGEFRLAQPIRRAADPTSVNELLGAFKSLAVQEFVADDVEDLTPYGLAEGFLVVAVRAAGRDEVVHLGADKSDEACYARRADEKHVVAVPRPVVEILRRPWIGYVDRQVSRIDSPGRVQRILCRDGQVERVYERDASGRWHRAGETEELPLVGEIVDLLRDMDASEVLGPDQAETLPPPVALELLDGEGHPVQRLRLYRRDDGRVLAAVPDLDLLFLLKQRDGGDLLELAR